MPSEHPVSAPTSLPMSPTQAAQATGTSRRSIMRAIESQQLTAFRDNRNHWKITSQALDTWANAQCAPTVQLPNNTPLLPIVEDTTSELKSEREGRRLAEVEAAELRGKLVATEAERDRLHEIVKNLTATEPKRRWWPFR